MTDKALANAEAKRIQLLDRKRALLRELSEIDANVEQIDRFIRAWYAFAEDDVNLAVDNLTDSERNESEQSPPERKRTTGNSPKEEVAAVAREVILERGTPIMRDELYDLLTARGLVIQGKDPKMVLSTMLWRVKDQIARVEGSGYWPTDVPNSEVGYEPTKAREFDSVLNTPASEILDPNSPEYKDASENAG